MTRSVPRLPTCSWMTERPPLSLIDRLLEGAGAFPRTGRVEARSCGRAVDVVGVSVASVSADGRGVVAGAPWVSRARAGTAGADSVGDADRTLSEDLAALPPPTG